MIVKIGVAALMILAASCAGSATFLFFGHYWHRLINSQPDPDGPSYTLN